MIQKLNFLTLSLLVLIFDQLSKWSVTEVMLRPSIYNGAKGLGLTQWFTQAPDRLPYHEIALLPFLNIVMIWNKGVSFGMFTQSSTTGVWILVALTAFIIILFLIWLFKNKNPVQNFAIALVIGGALGNVIDRIRFGAVIDFVDVHAFGWHYPAFNLADSCIVIGISILILYSLFFEKTVKD